MRTPKWLPVRERMRMRHEIIKKKSKTTRVLGVPPIRRSLLCVGCRHEVKKCFKTLD